MKVKGFAWPFLLFFPLIASVGFGFLYTTSLDSTTASLLGYQILIGVGLGAAIQNTVSFFFQCMREFCIEVCHVAGCCSG